MAVTYAYGTYPPLIRTANCRIRASASGRSLRMANPVTIAAVPPSTTQGSSRSQVEN